MNDKPVYWDAQRGQFYWIEWEETGNNDIPHRHYITLDTVEKSVMVENMKKHKHCKDCIWWSWDSLDPDGICMNKSKKPCTREKRQLWEKLEKSKK